METNKTTKSDIYRIDPRNIFVKENFNSRVDFGDLEELASQIKEQGVLNPITVIPFTDDEGKEKYRLVDGERRYRATMLLIECGFDIPRIPALFQPKATTEEEMLIQQLTRNEGKGFNEYELGIAYNKFRKLGYTNAEIAQKLGVKRWKIDCFLAHLDRDEKVQELLKYGRISGADVRRIYQASKNEQAAVKQIMKLAEKAEDKGEQKLTLKDLELDADYNIQKDTSAVKKGLSTLFMYIDRYTKSGSVELGIDVFDVYEGIKNGKTLKSIFEDALAAQAPRKMLAE